MRTRARRMGAGLAVTSLLALQVFSGVGQAANPAGWSMTVIQQPEGIGTGNLAGFEITISNIGPSNISQFFFIDSPALVPSYLATTYGTGICVTDPDLKCDLSPFNAGESITITVAYAPTSNFTYTPEANTTGVPSGKNNSHGDSLFANPKTYTTTVSSNRNFGGAFLPTGGSVGNDTSINGSNKQSVQLFALGSAIGASVEDALPNNAYSCSSDPLCTGFIGEWSRLRVDGGQVQGTPFKAVITIKTSTSFTQAQLDSMLAFHVLDGSGAVVRIGDTTTQTPGQPQSAYSERCGGTTVPAKPSPDGCIHAAKVGGNLVLTFWLTQNGGMRR